MTVDAETVEAIAHWERLADEKDAQADWDTKMGRDVTVGRRNANLYRMTAKAMRLGVETGKAHCACHALPTSDCPRRTANRKRQRPW